MPFLRTTAVLTLLLLPGCGIDTARADEAYLCEDGRIIYVKFGDLERLKRTEPCIAAYYGLTVNPETPQEPHAETSAAPPTAPEPESPGETPAMPAPEPSAASRPSEAPGARATEPELKRTTFSDADTGSTRPINLAEARNAPANPTTRRKQLANPALGPIVWGAPSTPAAPQPAAPAQPQGPPGAVRIINAAQGESAWYAPER